MKCPGCGNAEATGNFCSSCGTSLGVRHCTSCGVQSAPGARFCAACGASLNPEAAAPAPTGRAPARAVSPGAPAAGPVPGAGLSPSTLGWVISGFLLLGVVLVVGLPRLTNQAAVNAPFAGGAAPLGAGVAPDISNMSPREAADRLWDRVVRAAEAGDSTGARAFVPMGIAAYQRVGDLDADGLYHLSMLQRIGGDFESAIATAEEVLATQPDHLLALGAAGDAAVELGDSSRANGYFQHLIDIYDAELGKALPEYQAHNNAMAGILEGARASVVGR